MCCSNAFNKKSVIFSFIFSIIQIKYGQVVEESEQRTNNQMKFQILNVNSLRRNICRRWFIYVSIFLLCFFLLDNEIMKKDREKQELPSNEAILKKKKRVSCPYEKKQRHFFTKTLTIFFRFHSLIKKGLFFVLFQ